MTQDNPGPRGSADFNAYDEVNRQGLKRFPDYILCGQLNLHKSPECAASLAKYIDKQWDFLRVNHNGVISSKQLEINRNPEAFGGKKNGKPLTVTEWHKLQRKKNDDKIKKAAAEERARAQSATTGAIGAAGDLPRGRGQRGRSNSRSRGRRARGTVRGGGNSSRGRSPGTRGRGQGNGGRGTALSPSSGQTTRAGIQRGAKEPRGARGSFPYYY